MPSIGEMKDAATWPVMLIGITASMGGFLFGSDTGQLSGYIIMEVSFILSQTSTKAEY